MFSYYKFGFGHLLVILIQINIKLSYPWLEQITRQEKLVNGCSQFIGERNLEEILINRTNFDHILVDHVHKLLYCYVPKVACTNWKRIMMILTGKAKVNNLFDIPSSLAHADNSTIRLSQLDDNQIRDCLKNYFGFIIVRHPFERLLSAYRNKFEETYSHYFQMRYGRDIIKKYRQNPSLKELNDGMNVTFGEFVKFLLDGGLLLNEHWKPIYNLCLPCHLNYSFISYYETLIDDTNKLFEMFQIQLTFPFIKKYSNTSKKLKYYFQQLSIQEIYQLYELYKMDFKLFGYNLEDLLGYDLG